MELLCLNKKCNHNKNALCQNVTLFVTCFQFSEKDSKYIVEKYFEELGDDKNEQ